MKSLCFILMIFFNFILKFLVNMTFSCLTYLSAPTHNPGRDVSDRMKRSKRLNREDRMDRKERMSRSKRMNHNKYNPPQRTPSSHTFHSCSTAMAALSNNWTIGVKLAKGIKRRGPL